MSNIERAAREDYEASLQRRCAALEQQAARAERAEAAQRVIDAARVAMDASKDYDDIIGVPDDLAASLSLALDEYDAGRTAPVAEAAQPEALENAYARGVAKGFEVGLRAEAAQRVPQWISAEDRLPGEQGKDSEDVLVFLNGHCALTDMECRAGGGWGVRIGYYDAETGEFRVGGRITREVTHWMPLPAAPTATEPKGEQG